MNRRSVNLFACPNDFGPLYQVGAGLRCELCGQDFVVSNGILDLLPTGPSQSRLRDNYNATFSQRRDRLWLQPFRALIANLGNAYLYSWAARRIERIAGAAPLAILDAACGDGMLRRRISDRHQYFGVDFSSRLLLRAMRSYPAEYIRGDLTRLPFADASFDVVVSLQALQYLENPQEAIHQIARVLKPGGQFLLSVPNMRSNKYRLLGVPSIQLQRFDRENLLALLSPYLEVKEVKARGLWVPLPKVSLHLPGRYSPSIGLSWTSINTRRS